MSRRYYFIGYALGQIVAPGDGFLLDRGTEFYDFNKVIRREHGGVGQDGQRHIFNVTCQTQSYVMRQPTGVTQAL